MPHTPTLAWLPFTHTITHHRRRITAFFAYSYPASFALVFTLRLVFYLLLPHLRRSLIALKGAFPLNMSWHQQMLQVLSFQASKALATQLLLIAVVLPG